MNPKSVVDLRIYTMRQGGVPEFLRLAKEVVLPVQLRHVGPPVAYYHTDFGPQQEVMHLWGYDSLADMEARRLARNQDPEWTKYGAQSDGLIAKQENVILRRVALPLPDDLAHDASASQPLVEFRVTTLYRRRMPEYLRLFEKYALDVQLNKIGSPAGFYAADIGQLNQLYQFWGYRDYADMERRRVSRDQHPRWAEFLKATEPLVAAESVRMVRKVPGL
jgi:hypothetical protein